MRNLAFGQFGPGVPMDTPRMVSIVRYDLLIADTSSLYVSTLLPMTKDVLASRSEYGSPAAKEGLLLNFRFPRIFSSACSTALRT